MPALDAARFPFLGGLSAGARRELESLPAVRVGPRQTLLRRGAQAGGAYLVVQGRLRVYYVTDAGREATLYSVEPGGTCVLALSATLQDAEYPAWVVSGPRGAGFVRIPAAVFHRLLDSERGFRTFVFDALSSRLFELMASLEELGSVQLEQRLARYLCRRAEREHTMLLSLTQEAVASELGSAREVVFRALRSLAGRGLVQTGRAQIRVVDLTGLAQAAGLGRRDGSPQRLLPTSRKSNLSF